MKTKLLAKSALGALALSLFSAGTAHAAGTAAGTTVSNTFTLDYEVGGVAQSQIDTSDTSTTDGPTEFTVDHVVDLVVAAADDEVDVFPGMKDQHMVFTISNDGNATQAYKVTLDDSETDTLDLTPKTYVFSAETDGSCNTAATNLTATNEFTSGNVTADVTADSKLCVVVVADIPDTANDEEKDVRGLLAETVSPSADGNTALTADSDGNSLAGDAEVIFSESAGTDGVSGDDSSDSDGNHSAKSTYVVASADLEATKEVKIFSEDGTGCSTIPGTAATGEQYAVPGACVEYTITLENKGSVSATDIVLEDILSNDLTFIAADADGFTDDAFDPALPSADTNCGSATGACTIKLKNSAAAEGVVLASGATGTLTIRAKIN